MTDEGTLPQIRLRGVRIENEEVSEVIRKSARGNASASHRELGNEILVFSSPKIILQQGRPGTNVYSEDLGQERGPGFG
jgi:hypothetical protein